MISYIFDEHGNKTHAVVPIEEWEKVNGEIKDHPTTVFNDDMPMLIDDCPNRQLRRMLPLVEGMELDSVKEWKKEYKAFYKYMETLQYKDIDILYMLRTNDFVYHISRCNEDTLHIIRDYYGISKKLDSSLTVDDCKEISKAVFTLDDEQFLKFFNSEYKKKNVKEKKIRIDAEINRLFIYDLMERFPRCMDLEYDITVKQAQEKLMKYLYDSRKGAKTQVQRAFKQANALTAI